jgi:precorrin-2 methylase
MENYNVSSLETGMAIIDTRLIHKVTQMFSDESVQLEAGITALILTAARASHEMGISPEKFGILCMALRRLAEEDDLSKFTVPIAQA